jgi:hypothetical protein
MSSIRRTTKDASALSQKTKPMPARFNKVTQHLQEVQIERNKQVVAGLGVRRTLDPVANRSRSRAI